MKRPNILFILSDDQGAWALRCAGNTDILTPNLDRLAQRGVRFENFFCVSPVCSPARASILTGTIPSVHGVHDWLRGGNFSADQPGVLPRFSYEGETGPIRYTDHLTGYTDLLAQNGYTCSLAGKWHLGDSFHPQHGYSRWYTIGRGGCPYYDADIIEDGVMHKGEGYVTDLFTQRALSELETLSQQDAPFYLSVHYTAPHSPWDEDNHPKEYWDLYEDCTFTATPELPIHPWQVNSAPYGTGETRKQLLRGYYAAITAMDHNIGLLLDKLEELGIAEDTLVIFTGDNGMNMGHHGIWGKGNGTFPQNMYDTSVKVPCIISWPGHYDAGRVEDRLCSHYDLFPTLVDCLDLQGEIRQPLPGRSIRPILEGTAAPGADEGSIVVFDEYGPVRMIRNREWKYIHRVPYGPDELYHLADDPGEEHNLIDRPETAEVQRALRAELQQWFVRWADPALDGGREPVTGMGQLCRAGIYAEGREVYWESDLYKNTVRK
ncbi:MAG: sulfatase-like hydrolase/transferase [Candidatus Spyradocola sp.]|nr:sulfatase-like hydrolase/transferase [Candidatus Spyradocola sp.]